ncbi:MAG: DUF1499 domain-containing protein [bacterium]|nr:DUF1499 domain-containing protein [bacterium]
MLKFIAIIALLGIVILIGIRTRAKSAPRPDNLGLSGGTLAPCPDSPNCVSTQAERETHHMYPWPYESKDNAHQHLLNILKTLDRTTITQTTPDYIAVEFRSKLFGFIDDVEFYFEPDKNLLHFRSASRLGYSDMGVNRKRMETIGQMFQSTQK